MRRPWVAGNWKMNGTQAQAEALLSELSELRHFSEIDVCLAPPAPYWLQISAAVNGSAVRVLAQTVSEFDSGAYTGELSSTMLKDCGVSGALVGHSERRQLFAETDSVVAAKFMALRQAGLSPVLCVGETLAEREAGETLSAVSPQLLAVFDADCAAALRIVYGGSVKASNAQGLFAMPDIDGALVGGASLQATEFLAICRAAQQAL